MRLRQALVTTVFSVAALSITAGTAAAHPNPPAPPPGTHNVARYAPPAGMVPVRPAATGLLAPQAQAQLGTMLRPLLARAGVATVTGATVGSGLGQQAGCMTAATVGPSLATTLGLPASLPLGPLGCVTGAAIGAAGGAAAFATPALLEAAVTVLSNLHVN